MKQFLVDDSCHFRDWEAVPSHINFGGKKKKSFLQEGYWISQQTGPNDKPVTLSPRTGNAGSSNKEVRSHTSSCSVNYGPVLIRSF